MNNNFEKPNREHFPQELAAELVRPQIMKRIYMDNIPRNIKKRAIALLNTEETTLATDKATTKKQKLGKGALQCSEVKP
ncbi:unnamed protein product [Acanthoscelides obtectus]|uniref:Uncharacterized protein n=1 Tax=Acanthoscelides obtectus TaxID=200917 RepID=A0A9P0QEX2_ACAOB|nr:unnamed protein product [Acanthoscelides obtectus]CAK1635831.1 hypothetical protein AOBTE_LOCUS9546 [Acanthoscelides obtectus]